MLRPVEIAVLLAFLVPAAGLVGFLAWHMGARRTFKRRMREVPVRAISELKEGETARVVGAVVCARPEPAPLTKRPCAYWQVLVEERKRRNDIGYWDAIVEEHGGTIVARNREAGGLEVTITVPLTDGAPIRGR